MKTQKRTAEVREAIRFFLQEVLEPFKEAGNIYDDYKQDGAWTDEQYQAQLDVLAKYLHDLDKEIGEGSKFP
jgi:hypothetical protein